MFSNINGKNLVAYHIKDFTNNRSKKKKKKKSLNNGKNIQ